MGEDCEAGLKSDTYEVIIDLEHFICSVHFEFP